VPDYRGTSTTYLLARFRREGLGELADAVEAGRLSATAAAVELGWVRRPEGAGERRPNASKLRAGVLRGLRREGVLPRAESELGPGEKMELTIGPGAMGSFFHTREELRAAWEQSREELLRRAAAGRRPASFYEFEWEGARPSYDTERSTFWRLGLLSEAEKSVLEAEWRDEFDYAQEPDFSIAQPWPDEALKGHRARREHFAWADIPVELRQRWRAERRARRKSAA
jgi:hypothetical protein